jgi:drug/metabolite transporter (DMT)-like permease
MKFTLIVTLILVLAGIIYGFIFGDFSTFTQSIAVEPWLQFMVFDFYVFALIFVAWMWKREKILWQKISWTLAFLLGGSAGLLVYLIFRLDDSKKGVK